MRHNPRIDHLARLVDNLLDGLAAHGCPAPTAPQVRAALRELQRGRRGRRPPAGRTPANSPNATLFHRARIAQFPAHTHRSPPFHVSRRR